MKKLLLSTLSIIAFGFGVKAQNVNIPDANFKAYLVGKALINTNGDAEIQVAEANAFSGEITCSGLSIMDLTGIEEFTALTILNCSNNFLTTLDVSANTALTSIMCRNNFLTSMDLSANVSLTDIKCQANHLINLNIANGNNINITNFDARDNSLTCINVDSPTSNIANWSGLINAGAYFDANCSVTLQAEIIYVDINATGNNDGTSWTDAFTNLMSATINANHLSQIWVAAGTYYPSSTGNRSLSFEPIAEMYGGFYGTEAHLSERDWEANPTILSGDIGNVGDETDNTYTVLNLRASDSIVIDGFTISNGYSDHATDPIKKYGAGVYIINGVTPIAIKNCIVKNNIARASTGIYCKMNVPGKTKNITIENTRITQNKARWATAFDMMVVDGILDANLINCLVDSNQTLNLFSSNGFTYSGGRFIEYAVGGDFGNPKMNGKMINCTFTENIDFGPPTPRAAVGVQGPTLDLEIYNTIFWYAIGNITSIDNGTQPEPNSVLVNNTISTDVMNTATYVTSTNNTQTDPLFTDPALMDYTLQSGSPAIDGGSTSGIMSLIPTTDLAGGVRENGVIDLGCYEYCLGTAIDVTTTISNQTVTANESSAGVTYQWLDCNNNNTPLVGETSQSFTATTDGDYACEITFGCNLDVTACVSVIGVGLNEQKIQNSLSIYPNPASSLITIDNTELTIESISIIDVTGKTIKSIVPTNNTFDVSNLVNGIYFLQVQTKEGLISKKFIKE